MHDVQALYLRHLGAAAETREVDGAIAVRTGILSNTENGVVSTAAKIDPAIVDALIEWLADVPASWIALEPALGATLAAAGATPENDAWLLRGPVGDPAEPRHQVRGVRTREELDEWLDVLRDCGWWDDVEPARRLYQRLGTDGLYIAQDGAASGVLRAPDRVPEHGRGARAAAAARDRNGAGTGTAARGARAWLHPSRPRSLARRQQVVARARLPPRAAAAWLLVLPADPRLEPRERGTLHAVGLHATVEGARMGQRSGMSPERRRELRAGQVRGGAPFLAFRGKAERADRQA